MHNISNTHILIKSALTSERFLFAKNNKMIKYLIFILILSSLFACNPQPKSQCKSLQSKYPDVLNINKIPANQNDLSAFGFSDMGAWHAYSLAPKDSSGFAAGFIGPLLMKDLSYWLGNKSMQLQLTKDKGFIKFDSIENHYYPGRLVQKLIAGNLKITQQVIFTDKRTALFVYRIKNTGNKTQKISWSLLNSYFTDNLKTLKSGNQLRINLPNGTFILNSFSVADFNLENLPHATIIKGNKSISLEKGEDFELKILQSYFFNEKEFKESRKQLANYLNNTDSCLKSNAARWNTYIRNTFLQGNQYLDTLKYEKLAVKSIITLISNWRSPSGALRHNGLFPSSAYKWFNGFWAWDSWKHAVALAHFDVFLAKESVRSMFDYQDTAGMVADCIYRDSTENNWRDTKPPLAAWAVMEIFKQSKDTAFVKEMYPKLKKYHQWWYKSRDVNKNGICEYGSTDGSLIAAKWESGMDNAVRFDHAKILKTNEHAWSMNIESVDLNVFLQKEKEYLSRLAEIAGFENDATNYTADAKSLKEKIRRYFWSDDKRYFFDYNFTEKKLIEVYGTEGWLPLYTGLASREQASGIIKVMMDSSKFNTLIPLPTLDASNPEFNPLKGYWRGPVWLDQVYFGIKGLENYGYKKEATQLKYKLFNNAEGLLTKQAIRENYHPLTGKGLNAAHFSWSAAHILLMLNK